MKVLAQLQALGVTHVDHHFASHYHSDHIGLTPTIFGTGGVTLDYGWDRGGSYTTAAYTNYVNTLGARRRTMVKDQVVTLDSLSAHPVTIKCVNLNGAGITYDRREHAEHGAQDQLRRVRRGVRRRLSAATIPATTGTSRASSARRSGRSRSYKVHHHGSGDLDQPDLAQRHPGQDRR